MAEQREAQILDFSPAIGNEAAKSDLRENLRMVEAIVFASGEPVSEACSALPDLLQQEPL